MKGKNSATSKEKATFAAEENGKPITFAQIMEQKRDMLSELFNSVKNKVVESRPISIGKLTEEGKKYLAGISGLNFREFTDFFINASDLRHIYNDHYGENEKDKGNNIPLTDDDIKIMVDVIVAPDEVFYLGYDKKKDCIKFEFLKGNENGMYHLIEVYGEKGGKLTAKTFFNKKRVAANEVMKPKKLPPLYVRNVSGASPFFRKAPRLIAIKAEAVFVGKDRENSEAGNRGGENIS